MPPSGRDACLQSGSRARRPLGTRPVGRGAPLRRDGPSYAAATRFLTPLLLGQQRGRRPLTRSGVYYLPFALPLNVVGPAVFALHVADGSQVITRNVKGPSLTVRVGSYGRETYGACLARLTPAKLADGYLPILQTSYRDESGVRYAQESFAGRVDGSPSIVSFIRLDVDATSSARAAVVRLVPSLPRLSATDDRLLTAAGARLIVSSGGAYDGHAFRFTVPAGETGVVYAIWLSRPAHARKLVADEATYEKIRRRRPALLGRPARRGGDVLRSGAADRPGAARDARAADRPDLALQRRQPVRGVVVRRGARHGAGDGGLRLPDVADGILRFSLDRLPIRFSSWRAGDCTSPRSANYNLYRDRRRWSSRRRASQPWPTRAQPTGPGRSSGRLLPEQLSTDLPQRSTA